MQDDLNPDEEFQTYDEQELNVAKKRKVAIMKQTVERGMTAVQASFPILKVILVYDDGE